MDNRSEIIKDAIQDGLSIVIKDIKEYVRKETQKMFYNEVLDAIKFLNKFYDCQEKRKSFFNGTMENFVPTGFGENFYWNYSDNEVFRVIANCDNDDISKMINKKIDARMKFFYESLYRRKIIEAEEKIRKGFQNENNAVSD